LLESLKQWFEDTLGKLSRKSDTAKAVRYALVSWEALLRYVDDGRLEIDNNAAERALRAVALALFKQNLTAHRECGQLKSELEILPASFKTKKNPADKPNNQRCGKEDQ
jgi:hypothetical protein